MEVVLLTAFWASGFIADAKATAARAADASLDAAEGTWTLPCPLKPPDTLGVRCGPRQVLPLGCLETWSVQPSGSARYKEKAWPSDDLSDPNSDGKVESNSMI